MLLEESSGNGTVQREWSEVEIPLSMEHELNTG
jgi:hypothetical protein